MCTFVRPYTAGLAAASACILTLGLVTAPPDTDVTVAHAEARAVQLAAVTEADIRTAVGQAPLTFTAAVKSASLPTYATTNTPTTSVSHPAVTTQEATSSANADNPYLPEWAASILAVIFIVALPILLSTSIAMYAWNTVVYIPNRVLDTFGLPGLPCVSPCFYNIFQAPLSPFWLPAATTSAAPTAAVDSAGNSVSAPAGESASVTSRVARPGRIHGNKTVGPNVRASSTTSKPVADEAAAAKPVPPAAKVGNTSALPARAVSQSKPDKEAATDAAAAHSTGSNKKAKAVSTGKPAKKPAAHSPAAKSTGSKNAGRQAKSDR